MNENTLKNLNNLTRMLGADRLLTSEDVLAIKEAIIGILANNKKEVEGLTQETKVTVEAVLNKILDEHDTYLKNTEKMAHEVKYSTTDAVKKAMEETETVKRLCKEVMESKPKDGEDADEEKIVADVLAQIKLPEYKEVILDDGGQIVDKINSLPVNEENQIDASHIKNLPKVKSVGGGITQARVLQLIEENAGSGTPGGSTTQLQYNNAGSFGGISGATTDGTVTTFASNGLKATNLIATGSGGFLVESNSGTQVALFGAGGSTGSSLTGTTNIGSASADYIQIAGNTGSTTQTATGSSTDIDITLIPKGAGKFKVTGNANISGLTASQITATNASKDLVSLDTATYPSLTELSYVKGVTSAIQTQLNAKGAGTVTSVSSTNGALTVATGTTTPSLTVNSAPILTTARTIGIITGDATSAGSSFDGSANNTNALTLATVNSNVGSFGSATAAPAVTVNAKGLVTAVTTNTITPAVGSITGLGTGVGTALAVNVGTAGAFVTNGGALGTPSSGTVTNLTGTASININGTVGATTPTTGSFTTVTTSGNIELGNASDTTISRVSTGVAAIEGNNIVVNTSSPTLATITTTGNIELGNASDTTLSRVSAGVMAIEGVTVATSSNTLTLTNKRPQPRTASSTTASTLTPDLSSANVYYRTTQTASLTIEAPTGTPVIGETIAIYVDSAGAQTLTMNSTYKAFGAAFPATTTAGKTLMITAQYNGTDWKTLWATAV